MNVVVRGNKIKFYDSYLFSSFFFFYLLKANDTLQAMHLNKDTFF